MEQHREISKEDLVGLYQGECENVKSLRAFLKRIQFRNEWRRIFKGHPASPDSSGKWLLKWCMLVCVGVCRCVCVCVCVCVCTCMSHGCMFACMHAFR